MYPLRFVLRMHCIIVDYAAKEKADILQNAFSMISADEIIIAVSPGRDKRDYCRIIIRYCF